jgi:hypothetical protein
MHSLPVPTEAAFLSVHWDSIVQNFSKQLELDKLDIFTLDEELDETLEDRLKLRSDELEEEADEEHDDMLEDELKWRSDELDEELDEMHEDELKWRNDELSEEIDEELDELLEAELK